MDPQGNNMVFDVWKEWVRLREGGGHGWIQGFVEQRLSAPEQCQAAITAIRKWEKAFQQQTRDHREG